jgi:Rrf2 family protein
MLVTKKFLYAVELLRELRRNGPATRDALAAATRVPADFSDQILRDLRQAGLVVSKKGPRGGYALNTGVYSSYEISAREVLAATSKKSKRKLSDIEEAILRALAEVQV